MKFPDCIAPQGLNLVKYSGKEFVNKLGLEIVQGVVASILKGKNVRDLTESLTQRRILLVSASLITTYLKGLSSFDNFEEALNDLVKKNVRMKLSAEEKKYLLWFIGLTGKSIQNVIRGTMLENYIDVFDANLREICTDIEEAYGDITLKVNYNEQGYFLKWKNLLRCLLAVGAATLTIRGSEKSLYGKTFEKFVLGSVLTILGFSHIDKSDVSKSDKVFWLSERLDKRESDATLLVKAGTGVRFDIGFIGKGNTEVSLDKVSRFERFMEFGRKKYATTTIILVDNIGSHSRITTMAQEIDGHILQMGETYWVYKLATILKEKFGYHSEILNNTKEQSLSYIDEKMRSVNLNAFFRGENEMEEDE